MVQAPSHQVLWYLLPEGRCVKQGSGEWEHRRSQEAMQAADGTPTGSQWFSQSFPDGSGLDFSRARVSELCSQYVRPCHGLFPSATWWWQPRPHTAAGASVPMAEPSSHARHLSA